MKISFFLALFFLGVLQVQAELIFTEQAVVSELPSSGDVFPAHHVAVGDPLTIEYRISVPSQDPFGDPDSVVYDQVKLSVHDGTFELFASHKAELTIWNLQGFYGLGASDFDGPFLDFLASSDSHVIADGFLVSGKAIDDFDSASGGSVFADGEAIGFHTKAYSIAGSLPAVPESTTFDTTAVLVLGVLVAGRVQMRKRWQIS